MTLPPGWRLDTETTSDGATTREPSTLRHPEPSVRLVQDFAPALTAGWYSLTLDYDTPGVVDARIELLFEDGTGLPQHLAKTGRHAFYGLYRPGTPLAGVAVTVSGSGNLAAPRQIVFRAVSPWEQRRALLRRCLAVLKGDPRGFLWRAARFAVQLQRQGRTTIPQTTESRSPNDAYALWRERFDERPEAEAGFQRARAERMVRKPLFTVVAGPDFDAAATALLQDSLLAQYYSGWELLLPGDAPAQDPRIRRYTASAQVLAGARGEAVLLPRPGTVLRPHALTVFALALDRIPEAKIVYADEDRLRTAAPAERTAPAFKPAWSPQRLATADYIGDPCCIALPLLRAVGPEAGLDGDGARHALLLRITQELHPREVLHIAQVLSHVSGARPEAAVEARKAVIRDAMARRGVEARVTSDPRSPHPRLAYAPEARPLVSLIVPTRDRADLLRVSIGSIRAKTAYPAFEIIVVDNGSREDETFRLFESWAGDAAIRVIRDDAPFNYARLNNRAAAVAHGLLLGLVNNDVEVEDASWLDELVGLALQPGIGCVGAKLWYPDARLQHGGVVTGIAGAAGHRHKRAARGDRGQLDGLVTVNEVSAVTAACLVVRKAIYDEVGGLDEHRFAVAYNDVDFCLKVATAGYRNLWTPFAELVHHESVSRGRDLSPKTAERFIRETANLKLRWGNRLLDDPYYSPNLTLDAENGATRVQ